MKNKIPSSNYGVSGLFFNLRRRGFEIAFLLTFMFGLFPNFALAQGLPLENFDSGIPNTWVINSNQTVGSNWVATPTGGYQGTGGATVNPTANNTAGKTAEYYLIAPKFNAPNVTEIRFLTKQASFSNKGTIFQLRMSTAPQPSIGNFTVVQQWDETTLNAPATTYQEKIVTLPTIPAGTPVYLAFVAVVPDTTPANGGETWFVDNVRVIESCAPVAGITSSMTATGGTITWTSPASNFEIQIVPKGQGIAANGTPVSGTSYTASGLLDNTDYDVYIKTFCDPTTGSAWGGPFPVKTLKIGLSCTTPIVIPTNVTASPYVLSANLKTYYDNQTYTPLDSKGLSCQPISSTQNWLSGDHAFLSYTPTTSGLFNVDLSVDSKCAPNVLSSVFIFDNCTGIGTTANCLGSLVTGTAKGNTVQLPNIYLVGGKTYYFVISSAFQHSSTVDNAASICFIFKLSQPACSIPSGMVYDNLLQTSARFSWDNPQNFVNAWEYMIKPASQPAPADSDAGTPINTNSNNIISGLTAGTNYNFYVRSVCGSTKGSWTAALPFTTQCAVFPTPYSTNFGTPPSSGAITPDPCWGSLDLNHDNRTFVFSQDPSTQPVQGVFVSVSGAAANATDDMLISPQIHFDGVKAKRLTFKFYNYQVLVNSSGTDNGFNTFKVVLSTTGIGPNNFTTELLPLKTYQTGKGWITKIVVIPATIVGDVNIGWYLPPGANNINTASLKIDDVTIDDMPDCPEPQTPVVTASTITQTAAQFSWLNVYSNISQWQVVVQPLGSGVPANDNNAVKVDSSNSTVDADGNVIFNMTGLTPSTKYEYYVRSYCDATHQSIWVGPAKFNTLCNAQPTPYHESYDDTDTASKKFCWSVINKNNDFAKWNINATQAIINPSSPPAVGAPPFASYDDYLVSVPVNVSGNKILKFKYLVASSVFYPGNRSNYEVLMSSTPDFASPTILIPAHDVTAKPDYAEDFVIFTPATSGPAYFAIHLPSTMSDPTHTGPLVIDDFSIEDAPKCPSPSSLTVSGLTPNSATLNWTKGYVETQWEIAIQAPNLGVPTGSGTVVNTNSTYNAAGLTADTNYEYYVRAVCGSEFSDWTGPVAFKTTCNVLPTPFIETFEPNSTSKSCWTTVNSNNDLNVWYLSSTESPIFGQEDARINCYKNGKNDDYMITPTLAVKPNQRLRFYYKSLGALIGEDLQVQVSTQGTDISKFTTTIFDTAVSGVITNTTPKEMVINLTGITAPTNVNIAFHVPTLPPDPSGLRGSLLYIDNVIVEDIPACPSVYNVTTVANKISDKTALIDWETQGSETSWQISVQPFGTPAPVGNTLPQYLQTATSHPYTITGLTPSTRYQYYVRPVCGAASDNAWVGPIDLLTKCDLSNSCQYTISLSNGTGGGQVYDGLYVVQNGVNQQALTFPVVAPGQPTVKDYQVYLCSGIEFSLYWQGGGSGLQYVGAKVEIRDQDNNLVSTVMLGQPGQINSTIFTGISSCKAVTCPQPTNLAANNLGVLSWTPGGSETQWEVFVQPLAQGSIPQSGVIVNTPSYTPVASDFALSPTAGTNEFFVRAVCSSSDKSYWSGPKVFIRNDEPTTAVPLQVNTDGACTSQGVNASFIGATASTVPTSCQGVNNADIWYEFVAVSKVQTVELSNFNPGSYSAIGGINGDAFPTIVLSLYEVQADGSLVEKACSENNSLMTTYSSELTVGKTYKIRVKNVGAGLTDKKFDICVSTPADICELNAFNYSFEKLPLQDWRGDYMFSKLMPGWRTNTNAGLIFVRGGGSSEGEAAYEGGQFLQLLQDSSDAGNIVGLYKDFEVSSNISKINYSFASSQRAGQGASSIVELWAGQPAGPFTKIASYNSTIPYTWTLTSGTYDVPTGQTVTRFIFRGDANNHSLLDAANFKVPTNNILTADETLNCKKSTVTVSAEVGEAGIGEWVADTANPAPTVIASPQNPTTDISGLSTPGNYIYFWKTRYCEKPFKVTVDGVTVVPTVVSPVDYCTTDTPVALTATVPTDYKLQWYTVATGGTGSAIAPVPSVEVEGKTTYYVAAIDVNGCEGSRVAIDVVVKKCRLTVQKGISPGADGKNDSFDLTDLKVKRLEIFNRYGTEVYSKDNYTNEWHGQSNSGKDLPDGTYFYQIHSIDNKVTNGWVYINREQK